MNNRSVMSLRKSISQAIISHINNRYGSNIVYANSILAATKRLLSCNLPEYEFPKTIVAREHSQNAVEDDFQETLSKINEKEARRKKEGVYYTDRDVTDFLASNTMLHYIQSNQHKVYSYNKALRRLDNLSNDDKKRLITASAFDPTCGTGEFVLSALSIKIHIFRQLKGQRYENLANKFLTSNEL